MATRLVISCCNMTKADCSFNSAVTGRLNTYGNTTSRYATGAVDVSFHELDKKSGVIGARFEAGI